MRVAVKVPALGSNSSALARVLPRVVPPAIKTLPSVSKVAELRRRLEVISPVAAKVPGDCASTIEECSAPITSNRKTTLVFISFNSVFSSYRTAIVTPDWLNVFPTCTTTGTALPV